MGRSGSSAGTAVGIVGSDHDGMGRCQDDEY